MKLINRIGKRRINTLLFVILFALILYFALRSFGLFLDEEDMYQVALEYSIEEEYEKSNEGCVAEKPSCYNLIIESNEKGELPYEETLLMETLSK